MDGIIFAPSALGQTKKINSAAKELIMYRLSLHEQFTVKATQLYLKRRGEGRGQTNLGKLLSANPALLGQHYYVKLCHYYVIIMSQVIMSLLCHSLL